MDSQGCVPCGVGPGLRRACARRDASGGDIYYQFELAQISPPEANRREAPYGRDAKGVSFLQLDAEPRETVRAVAGGFDLHVGDVLQVILGFGTGVKQDRRAIQRRK
jgi:hypothetical protein